VRLSSGPTQNNAYAAGFAFAMMPLKRSRKLDQAIRRARLAANGNWDYLRSDSSQLRQ